MQNKLPLSLLTVALLSQLYAQELTLDTITVTSATKAQQKLQNVTANTEVITAEEIEEKRYTTVVQALESLSGINFSQNGGIGQHTSLFLHGFDASKTLVLIDGVRVNDVTTLNMTALFQHLMISDIERIEIIKGAQSGIWGADASAGVINIITKSAKDGLHVNANTEFGSYQTKKFSGAISYKNENFYLKVASQLLQSESFSAKVPAGANVNDFENDPYKNITTDLKAGITLTPTNKIDFSYTKIDATTEYDDTVYDLSWNVDEIASANSYAKSIAKNSFSQIAFNHIDSFNELKLYVKSSTFDNDYQDSYPRHLKGKVTEYGVNSKIPYRNKDFTLIALDYKKFAQNDSSIDNAYTNKAGALTNSNVLEISGEKFIFTEALRYDQYSQFENKTTGKIGFKYNSKILDNFSFNTNYATAYNVPTLTHLYGAWGANPNLKPEDVNSFDIGANYMGFKIGYFYNTINNMIDWEGSGYTNITGRSVLKGYEIGYNDFISDQLLADISYTYLNAKDKDGNKLLRRPKETVKYAFTYYPTKNLDITISGEYIGERYDLGAVQTGKYTLANFVTNYKINKGLTTYLKADNLFNKKYQVVDGYGTAERSIFVGLNFKIK